MAVPRNRSSNQKKNSRRAHHGWTPLQLINCKSCAQPKEPHHVCMNCGTYRGRVVLVKSKD